MYARIGWVGVILAVLTSCMATRGPEQTLSVSSTFPALPTDVVNQPAPAHSLSPLQTPPATPERVTELAVADLAKRLGVSEENIQIVSADQTEMPVENLGCLILGQEPGFTIPGVVLGYEVVLHYGGIDYLYRIHGLRVVYCGQRD